MHEIQDNARLLYPDLSYQIMGLAYEVYNNLGPGFTEDIYERALILELKKHAISYEAQKCVNVFYKGENMGVFRLDLVIDQKIILELKAVRELNDLFRQQLISYLRATGLRLGILINFGSEKLQSSRVVVGS